MKTIQFNLPVTVSINLSVDALNALTANDVIDMLVGGEAEITELIIENAVKADVSEAKKEQTANIYQSTVDSVKSSQTAGYLVVLYAGAQAKGDVIKEFFVQTQAEAEEYVKALTNDPLVSYGSVRVLNQMTKITLLSASSPRGGWEVSCFNEDDELISRNSWLQKDDTKAMIRRFLKRDNVASVIITDFTDRQLGPVTTRKVSL